ncbi:MAG: STAS domain-containing protein [Chloroflexaceae bacterium]|jgi:anti-anti-sigma regulatory factor|nr:STAS domain-containing protein [Chloroflexaceae bacterium]
MMQLAPRQVSLAVFGLTTVEAIVFVVLAVACMLLAGLALHQHQRLKQLHREAQERSATHDETPPLPIASPEEQRRLLAMVAALEPPAVILAEGVLFVPVAGPMSNLRWTQLTTRMLNAAAKERVRQVIFDLSGLQSVDEGAVQGLTQTIQALRLLGCAVALTGMAPELAALITNTGTALDGVTTARTPQEALKEGLPLGGTYGRGSFFDRN